jgi:bifunctional DNA-binding transcriptional regulator/antitoxin component of YhaV-PrlF toxin-antitoxin module
MTQDKIIEKLAKIKAHAESAKAIGNEEEAKAFAAMLQNLLLKHKLGMTDVEYAAEMKDEPIIEKWPDTELSYESRRRVYKDFPDVEVVNRRREWAEELAGIVADAYSCIALVVKGNSIVIFVGHRSNVAICEFLFLSMLRVADKLSANAAKAYRAEYRAKYGSGNTPKGYRESWLMGFCTRIAQRMKEERDAFGAKPGQNMALVRVNKEAIAVRDYTEKHYGKEATRLNQQKHHNSDGYEDGKAAANKININVNAGQPNRQPA